MNKHIIIGNLTRDPEMATRNDISCCTFTVAVNRRVRAGAHPEADYVRVTTWRGLADICYSNLGKGRKVCAMGASRAYGWIDQNGEARARIEMNADEVEFLDSKSRQQDTPEDTDDFTEVEDEDLPFH